MNSINDDRLRKVIVDLAAVDREGLLSELQEAFAAECRIQGGGCPPADRSKHVSTMQAGAEFKARELAKVASKLLGITEAKCNAIAREVFVIDPWSKIALQLISEYRRPSRLPTKEDIANWNPETGGPVVEQWEREKHEIALANARSGKQQGRKW